MRSWPTFIGLLLIALIGCQRPDPAAKPNLNNDKTSEQSNDDTAADSASRIAVAIPDPNDNSNSNQVATDVTALGTTTKPASDELQIINFDDLNLGMPEDSKFRPMMLGFNDRRAEKLNGCRINIGGHMNPPDQLKGLTEFVLLKNKDCKFGPGGQADHLMRVFLKDGKTTEYTDKVIYVEGILTIKPFPDDGPSTWSIYDVEATSVSTRAPSRQR